MKSFFKEAVNSINTSGTIHPSSKYLIKNCLKDLKLDSAKTILEFGPGNGCITEALLHKMDKSTQLYSLEINPKFYNFCKKKFSKNSNIHIINQSALDFDKVLKSENIKNVDYIISSLPLSFFKNTEITSLFHKITNHLTPQGSFVQYQYSFGKYPLLKQIFDKVDVNFTLLNIPPAVTYKCYPEK